MKKGAQGQCGKHSLGPLKKLESSNQKLADGHEQLAASRMADGSQQLSVRGMAIGMGMAIEMGMGMRMVGMGMRMESKAQACPSCWRHGGGCS